MSRKKTNLYSCLQITVRLNFGNSLKRIGKQDGQLIEKYKSALTEVNKHKLRKHVSGLQRKVSV